MHRRWTILLVVLAMAAGCSEGYAPPETSQGADAALSADATDAADAGAPDFDVDGMADAAPDGSSTTHDDTGNASTGDAGGTESCVPNHDGTIERGEVSFEVGLHATYRVAENVTVDTHGTEQSDGSRVWDLSGTLDGDHSVLVELRSLDGTWYKPEFPDATYAARLSDTDQQLGIFGADAQGLHLQGVVTPDDGMTRTDLTYDPPADILMFPLSQGDTWSSESTASGWYMGGYWTASEKYASQVDAHGTLKTPFGDFEVLRVRTDLTRTVGLMVTTQITYSFVSECFGTVATIRSQDNETQDEFTDAAEVRRLAR